MKVESATPDAALLALIHKSFAQASQALSTMLARPIDLHAPRAEVLSLSALPAAISLQSGDEILNIHIRVSGELEGVAALLLSPQSSARLINLLTEQPAMASAPTISDNEVLLEVSNILLNACLGFLANQLGIKLQFRIPRLDRDDLTMLLSLWESEEREKQIVILVSNEFRIRDGTAGGYFVLILDALSFARLRHHLEASATC